MPRAASGDDTLDRKVDTLFERWTAACDADGQLDIFGLQTLAVREMIEAGEVLIRRRPRRLSDGLAVPLQVQVIESDLLDNTRNGDLADGGRLLQGIEFDPLGRRRAYWLHAQHPGDAVVTMRRRLESLAIPASEVLHLYEKQRTQVRGVPWGTPVMRSAPCLSPPAGPPVVQRLSRGRFSGWTSAHRRLQRTCPRGRRPL